MSASAALQSGRNAAQTCSPLAEKTFDLWPGGPLGGPCRA